MYTQRQLAFFVDLKIRMTSSCYTCIQTVAGYDSFFMGVSRFRTRLCCLKRAQSMYFELFGARTKLPLGSRKNTNVSHPEYKKESERALFLSFLTFVLFN